MPNEKISFEYHDEGYIRLAPCTPYQRDVMVSYTKDSNEVTVASNQANTIMAGQYIYISGEWVRISAVQSDSTLIIGKRMEADGVEYCMVATMNELTISGEGLELTKFELDYTPLLR